VILTGDNGRIRIVEVGPRDGLQNEAELVPTDVKVRFIELLAEAGAPTIEQTSFVHAKWVPQLADASRVLEGTRHLQRANDMVLVPNGEGLVRAIAAGAANVAVFGAASEAFSRKNLNRTVDESVEMFRPVVTEAKARGMGVRAYVSTILGCPYQGHVPFEDVRSLVLRMFDLGADQVCLGDTIGVATPGETYDLIDRLRGDVDVDRLAVHMHDTYAQGLANSLAAIEAGVRVVDTAAGGMGGCPYAGPGASGNLATEDLVYSLERSGISTGINLDRLLAATSYISDALGKAPRSRVAQALLARPEAVVGQ
jgi:hydroxymethylglutaryl-CoA lyase